MNVAFRSVDDRFAATLNTNLISKLRYRQPLSTLVYGTPMLTKCEMQIILNTTVGLFYDVFRKDTMLGMINIFMYKLRLINQ